MNKNKYLEKAEIATSLLKDMEMAQETKKNKREVARAIRKYLASYVKCMAFMLISLPLLGMDEESLVNNPRRITEIQRYLDMGRYITAATLTTGTTVLFGIALFQDIHQKENSLCTVTTPHKDDIMLDIYRDIAGLSSFAYISGYYIKKTADTFRNPL